MLPHAIMITGLILHGELSNLYFSVTEKKHDFSFFLFFIEINDTHFLVAEKLEKKIFSTLSL